MQTLWSRVAQSRGSCRCPHCLHYASGISRRATASATRRMPKYLTSSTFWYSGIFAAAATWDASYKEKRREQWDRAIADLRHEVGQPARAEDDELFARQHERAEAEELLAGQEQRAEATEDVAAAYRPFGRPSRDIDSLDQGGPTPEIERQGSDIFCHVDPSAPRPEWPTNTGPPLDSYNLPPQSIYATDERKAERNIRIWTAKKLANSHISTEKFIYSLFIHLHNQGWAEEASRGVPEAFAELFLQDVELLKSQHLARCTRLDYLRQSDDHTFGLNQLDEHHPRNLNLGEDVKQICSFGQDDYGSHHLTARQLTRSLQDIFQERMQDRISSPVLLARVAYNLSLSSAAPPLETYNTLLLGFSKLQSTVMADDVILAMRETNIRPNEVSLAAILDHYTTTDNAAGFVRQIELMRGKHGGLCLARPDLEIKPNNTARLIRHETAEHKIIQLPYPTPYVFRAIISGVIKFSGFDTALRICERMRHEGWGVCMAGLTPLLKDCADRGDWENGKLIWRQMLALRGVSRRKEGGVWTAERIGMEALAAKLRLCSRRKEKEIFEGVWELGMRMWPGEGTAKRLMEVVKAQEGMRKAVTERNEARAAGNEVRKVLPIPFEDVAALARERVYGFAFERQPDPVHREHVLHDLQTAQALRKAPAIETVTSLPTVHSPQHTSVEESKRPRQPEQAQQQAPDKEPLAQVHGHFSEFGSIREEQLMGYMPAGDELNDYELRERPMRVSA